MPISVGVSRRARATVCPKDTNWAKTWASADALATRTTMPDNDPWVVGWVAAAAGLPALVAQPQPGTAHRPADGEPARDCRDHAGDGFAGRTPLPSRRRVRSGRGSLVRGRGPRGIGRGRRWSRGNAIGAAARAWVRVATRWNAARLASICIRARARGGSRTTSITTGKEPSLDANHVDDTVLVDLPVGDRAHDYCDRHRCPASGLVRSSDAVANPNR